MRDARRWGWLGLLLAGCATTEAPPPAATSEVETEAAAVASTAPQPVETREEEVAATPATPVVAPDPAPPVAEPAPPPPERAPETWDFTLERNEPWPDPGGGLATMGYPPSEAEKAFFERVAPKDAVMGMVPVQTLSREVGTFGSWFGVIRGYRRDEARNQTRLLVESKHFDGLTDTHILCLSFRGGGDFVLVMPGTDHQISGLAVVRVYGKVVSVKDDVPRIRAEFVREFPLGQYCFMNMFGEDHGNPRWREFCKVDVSGEDPDIYDPGPDLEYYVNLIGHPRDFVEGKVKVEVPLD